MSFAQVVLGALPAAILAICLTGCLEDVPEGDFMMKITSEDIEVVNCGPSLSGPLQLRLGETGGEFRDFFIGSTDEGWPAGGVLTSNPSGWDQIDRSETPSLADGSDLVVRVRSADGTRVARFRLEDGEYDEHSWLGSDGVSTEQPCDS